MSLYIKNESKSESLSPSCLMRHRELQPTNDFVSAGDNSYYHTIYSGYIQYNLLDANSTNIPYPSEWSKYTFLWVDLQNSYVTNQTVTYTIPFHDGTNRICAYVDKSKHRVVVNHNTGWGKYAVYLTLRMC